MRARQEGDSGAGRCAPHRAVSAAATSGRGRKTRAFRSVTAGASRRALLSSTTPLPGDAEASSDRGDVYEGAVLYGLLLLGSTGRRLPAGLGPARGSTFEAQVAQAIAIALLSGVWQRGQSLVWDTTWWRAAGPPAAWWPPASVRTSAATCCWSRRGRTIRG